MGERQGAGRVHRAVRMALVAGVLAALPVTVAATTAPASTTPVSEFGASGMNLDAAFANYTSGDPNVTIAYIEGGINWHLGDAATLASVVAVNWHVTPVPCTGTTLATATMVVGGVTEPCHTVYSTSEADYDPDGSGVVNAAQWAHDPRVTDANTNGVIDPEDLISAFCGPGYDPPPDASGLPCAISGWDFYDNQNDPATTDSAYGHANDQMDTIHAMCPKCTILPIKAGEEALDPTDNLAKAWEFAAQEGARVIVSVTADLGYSPFMRQVIDRLEAQGVVMVEASNDFDSNDHQGGMFWPYVIPGNGAVASADGTEWVRSDLTSFGPKAMFTVATGGGSTSESTPTTGGVIGLLLSYGDLAYADHLIPDPLSGPEAIQVLRDTATPFTDTSLGWPGTPVTPGAPDDWNEQYGYGMPNLDAAMAQVAADQVPPAATITSPDWYSTFDPTTTASVPVAGRVQAATAGTTFTAQLDAAPGGQPADSAFVPVGTVSGTGAYAGTLGTLDLSSLPSSFWSAPDAVATDPSLSTSDQYDVTLRLVVTDGSGNVAEDRRVITVVHDPTLLPGYPMAIDPGSAGAGSAGATGTDARSSGEASPQLADLTGDGHLDLIFGDAGGLVHAIDPATGAELPGWPVQTPPVSDVPPQTGIFAGVQPGGQSVLENVAVGDLFHNGSLEVVVVTLAGTVLVYDARGQLLPGWPQQLDLGVTPPPVPRPEDPNVRFPSTETGSPPVLAPLQGGSTLDVVVAGGDGYLHAWQPDGQPVPGWPVKVALPAGDHPPSGYVLEDDQRLEAAPTVAWLHGRSGGADIVERSQFSYIRGSGIQPLPDTFVFAYGPTGSLLHGWPVEIQGTAEYYGSAQEYVTEGSSSPVAADVTGDGTDVVADSPIWDTPLELTGSGTQAGSYGNTTAALTSLLDTESLGTSGCQTSPPPDVPIAFASSGAFGKLDGHLAYAQSEIGAASFGCLQDPNAELPLTEYESAYPADAAGGGATAELPGFPGPRQGDGFFTSPVISDVTGGGQESVIEGGDANTITAVSASGSEDSGFPKFTSGWDTSAPAVGDLLGNGHDDVVVLTREGYLYAWATPGEATANDQWWSARHDEWNSGNYGVDSRPPGALRNPTFAAATATTPATATFTAPGDNWYDGTVAGYTVTYAPTGRRVTVAPSGPAGTTQTVTGPPGTTGMTVQAFDGADNVDAPVTFGAAPPAPDTDAYVLASADGGIYSFAPPDSGQHYFGSLGGRPPAVPVVAVTSTPDHRGYWELDANAGVFAFGDAPYFGPSTCPSGPACAAEGTRAVALASTPDGRGYWIAEADGAVVPLGDAVAVGSMAGHHLSAPIVAMAATPDGGGYWLVGADGAVYAFGDARYLGSAVALHRSAPIVAAAATPDGHGYWLVGADGAVYAYGDARYEGSTGGHPLAAPVVSVVPTGDGAGYWLVGADGAVFADGDARYEGSTGGMHLAAPVVGASS